LCAISKLPLAAFDAVSGKSRDSTQGQTPSLSEEMLLSNGV